MPYPLKTQRFDSTVGQLPHPLAAILIQLPSEYRAQIHEVRLRSGKPLTVCIGQQTYFLDIQHHISSVLPREPLVISKEELQDAVLSLCDYSIHTHTDEMCSGYISLKGGSRAGLCGTAVVENERITSVGDITSINLRIAREIKGCATPLTKLFTKQDPPGGLLIAGAPGSGKTTLLRDLARQLADGLYGHCYKVTVVDERGEIGAVREGVVQCDIGITSDLLFGYPKAEGITIAVRTLSPQVILCDEIGTPQELEAVLQALHCGVPTVTTVHAGSFSELLQRPIGRSLLATGAFANIAVLQGAQAPCSIAELHTYQEVLQCGYLE